MQRHKTIMVNDKTIFDHKDMQNAKSSFHYFLDVIDEGIILYNEVDEILEQIAYSSMDYVSFSLCSRLDIGGYTRHQVDLDICSGDKILALEVYFPNSLQLLISQLIKNNVECIDMVGVIDLYKNYPDKLEREIYLRRHFNKIAKKYKLDHPRYKKMDRKEEVFMQRVSTLLLADKKTDKKVNIFERMASGWMPTSEITLYKYGEVPIEWFLDVKEEKLCFVDQNNKLIETLRYDEIEYVNFSLVFRHYAPNHRASLSYHYPVLLDIKTHQNTYALEVFYPHSLQKLIDQLQIHQVEYVDMVGVIQIYRDYPEIYDRDRYLRIHYSELAKKFGLEFK